MKIKITLLSILSLSIFSSCSKQPECDSEESIKLAKELIIQELKKNSDMAFAMFEIDEESVDNFVYENIELINVRPTEKNEELKRCDCATQISFKFSEELMQKLEGNEKGNIIISAINEMMTQQLDYNFTLQKINKDDQLIIEGIVPVEELQGVFMNYASMQKALNEESDKETLSQDALLGKEVSTVKKEDTDLSPNSGEIITEKSYIHKENNDYSKTKKYLIKGDIVELGIETYGFYQIYYYGKNNDKDIDGFIPVNEVRPLYVDKYGNKTYIEE
jgi:hypothetical protein